MKIKTNLYLLTVIFVIVIIAIGFVMYRTFGLINREVKMNNIAGTLIKDIFELNIVTNEYVMHHETRMLEQWHAKYDSLSNKLEMLMKRKVRPKDLSIIESIIIDYKALGNLFTQLVENNKQRTETDMHIRIEKMLTNEIMIRSQRISAQAFKFSSMMQQRISQVEHKSNLIILFSIIAFAILSFCGSFFVTRTIVRQIKKLTKGVELIGKGDLRHKIELRTKNEMSQLANTLNKMSEDLLESNRALRESKESLARAQQIACMGSWEWETVKNEIHWSEETCRLFGLMPHEFDNTYQTFLNFVHPEDREFVKKSVKESLYKRKPYNVDFRIVLRDGTERIIHSEAKVEFDENDKPFLMTGVSQDITERRRIEEVLQFTQFAVDNNADATYWVKSDAKISYANKAACQSLGYSYEELTCMRVPDIAPDFPNGSWSAYWQEIKKAGTLTFEAHHITKACLVFPVEIQSTYLEYEGQEYICAFVRNITERKRLEEKLKALNKSLEQRTKKLLRKSEKLMSEIITRERMEFALKESEERYRQIVSTTRDAIMVFDAKTRQFIEVNKACEELYGYSREEFLNMRHMDITAESEGTDGSIFKTNAGEPQNISLRYHRKKDGTVFPVEISASAFTYKDQNVLCGIIRDITERKQAEEQIKASLKEKEVLLKEVHHRVKNNLQIVSSLLDMSSMQTHNRKVIDLIVDSRNRINSMALVHSQLYKDERLNQIDMEKHIQELSKRLLQIYEMEKTITLDIKPTDISFPITRAVPCALVLNELISNTLKHAYRDGQKGKIDISMQRSDGDTFSIRVKDDGVGIPEEIDINTTNSLGLSLVRNLVLRQLSGKLFIIRNGGTEVVIEFKALKGDKT